MKSVDNLDATIAPQASPEGTLTPADLLLFGDLGKPQLENPAESVSKDSLDAARALARSLGRRVDGPVRKSFVRPMTPEPGLVAPLSKIYSGGRSGTVAIKLYLALVWQCAAPPFSTDKPARAWATLLDLEDPPGKGARRIKDALRTLAEANLIRLQARPGYPNVVTLLDESGSGAAYELPSSAYNLAQRHGAEEERLTALRYFKVPPALWIQGHMQKLSGPGLVMLLILLTEKAGIGEKVWFSTEEFPKRYNISHKTRAAGTRELLSKGLLTVESQSLGPRPGASAFDMRRRRKVYRLTSIAQVRAPENLPSPAPSPKTPQPSSQS